MDQKLDIYQKVSFKRIYEKNMPFAKYLSHKVNLGCKHMEHLKDIEKLSMDKEYNRVIIISDTKSAGFQAATYLMLKKTAIRMTPPSVQRYEEDEELFEDLVDECMEEFEEAEEEDTEDYNETQDMIVENAELWDPKTEENDSPNPIQMQKRLNCVQVVDSAVNVLLQCNRTEQDKEMILEEIIDRLERYQNFFLLLPSDSVSSNFVERLAFEYDFSIVHAKEPSMDQLQLIFNDLIMEYGLKLNKNVEVKEIIQNLKSYRGPLFWEKDMEKLIADTVKLLHGQPAGKEDFKLFYYNGKKPTGELQLQAMVGQKEAKAQIMRMTASAKLAEFQKEKYGESLPVYKHMAFQGAPGTGKTQIARITAQIFHEHGLSNGKFIEAGRNDLVAGYLGQTAIKIAKLFQKAKGGVIFIDEVGSLVQNDMDSYTKEAITALLQYMENNPDTTVIFATYNNEMERFLNSDRGLRSRVARIVDFQAYSVEELWDILKLMAAKQHFTIAEEAKEAVIQFIEDYKKIKKDEFGNAREMRKLLQVAQEEVALRFFRSYKNKGQEVITVEDIEKAIKSLMGQGPVKKVPFGFTYTPDRKEYLVGTD
jgi:AAA+ superfamily predicted ATPase/AcrR family transcriptional regulator